MGKFSHITKEKIEKSILKHDSMTLDEKKKYGADGTHYALLYGTNLYPVKRIVCIADNFTHFSNGIQDFNATEARKYIEKLGFEVIVISTSELSLEEKGFFNDEIEDENNKFFEGAKKQVTVNAYERDARARNECLKAHGYTCKICGFSFGKKYGKKFQYKIHVHHIKPLSEIQENYEVDPVKDLVPVCPNCHMILHSKGSGETYTIDEVKDMLV